MLKKIVLGLLLTSSLFAETELWKFFKYSTAYASFSKVVDFWFNNQENDNKLLEHADDLGEK